MKSLRSTGTLGGRARVAQVVQRAAEPDRLGEHRQRGGPAALVGAARPRASPEALADRPRRGRAPLVLGDHAPSPGRVSASLEGPAPPGGRPARGLQRPQRVRSRRRCDLLPRLARRSARARSSTGDSSRSARRAPSSARRRGPRRSLGRRRGRRRPGVDLRRRRTPRRPALSTARSRCGPGSPPKIRRASSRRWRPAGRRPGARAGARRAPVLGARPRSGAPRSPSTSTTRVVPEVLISSSPSALATTSALTRAEPCRRPGDRVQERRVGDADHLARGAGGVRQRAEEVEDRADGELLAHGHDVLRRDGCAGANMKPKPTSSMQRAIASGARSMRTPSASSTSAEPRRPVAERLPCLATAHPRRRRSAPRWLRR